MSSKKGQLKVKQAIKIKQAQEIAHQTLDSEWTCGFSFS